MKLILILLSCSFVHCQLGFQCDTPSGTNGTCTSVFACKPYIKVFKNIREKDLYLLDARKHYMNDSKCLGNSGPPYYDILVCCGKEDYCPKKLYQNRYEYTQEDCGSAESMNRIVGGTETAIGEYPWMALLRYENNSVDRGFSCGGFLISNRHVLTAAHCIEGKIRKDIGNLYQVRLGEHDLTIDPDYRSEQGCNEPHEDIDVEKSVIHEEYIAGNGNVNVNRANDIAIIKLAREVRFSEFRLPLCLPKSSDMRGATNATAYVAGWGIYDVIQGKTSSVKMAVSLRLWAQNECTKTTEGQFCAGGEEGKDSCRGDSGGPLMMFFPKSHTLYAEGIVSYGPRMCGTKDHPGVYVRVAYYLDWIRKQMEIL